MRFSDIPGQSGAKRALREAVESGHVPHAVMIAGPAGAGKMMLARAYVQYLQCESRIDGEPCGTCRNCRLNQDLSHPDVRFIFPFVKSKKSGRAICSDCSEQWQKMLREHPSMSEEAWQQILDTGNSQPKIYVEDAAEVVRLDSLPSYTSPYKVFVVWLPEKMNPETANKLLKVIEEPSDGTIFVMVSNNELQVLPTIFSRVQRIHASTLSDSDMAEYLTRNLGFPEHLARQYAPICQGSIIRADELGDDSGENEEFLDIYREVMRAAYSKRVGLLRKIGDKVAAMGREKNKRFLIYMARMLRENFIYNLRMPQLSTLTPDEEAFSSKFSPFICHTNVEDFLSQTDRARRDIERNANAKVVMFDYFLHVIILLHRR